MSALPQALPGTRFQLGGLSCYTAGQGPPLLLIHSVNAAASAAEVRPLYEHGSRTRTVFAIDLPGYGFSDRGDRVYTPRLMTDALHAMAEHIRAHCGPQPVDAVAVSLGCEFLARAAVEQPAHGAAWRWSAPLASTAARPGARRPAARARCPACTLC